MPRANRSAPSSRSGDERERAREERARRRLERDPALETPLPPPREPALETGEDRAPRGAPSMRVFASSRWPQLPRRPRPTRRRLAALLALIVVGLVAWLLVALFQPFAGAGSGRVVVDIPHGASASQIGSILARRGVVDSGFFFQLRALIEGRRGDLHSGRFLLARNMSYGAALAALSKPPPPLIPLKFVIPEGFTRLQVAKLAQDDALSGSYMAASQSSLQLRPADYGAPAGTGSLEGFLFPATYDLSAGAPVQTLVAQQLTAFRARFGAAEIARAHALGVTPYALLTVASMVEREARVPHDRPLIAAVIYNRLHRGMALGVDATVYYALALRDGISAYERELTASDLRIDSPYNTRAHPGLPPTPISNPGLESIEAAAHPGHVGYLYYVAAPDGCGEHVFATTYNQFQAEVAAYEAALSRAGGHLPPCKRG